VKAGFRVIAPDLRGFGGSDKPEGVENYTLQKVQSDVVQILDQLHVDR
jgi:pimeloyl-ACP methyl ester carboxylesterase